MEKSRSSKAWQAWKAGAERARKEEHRGRDFKAINDPTKVLANKMLPGSRQKVLIVKSADGKIQVRGLLPGQRIVQLPDGKMQIFSSLVKPMAGAKELEGGPTSLTVPQQMVTTVKPSPLESRGLDTQTSQLTDPSLQNSPNLTPIQPKPISPSLQNPVHAPTPAAPTVAGAGTLVRQNTVGIQSLGANLVTVKDDQLSLQGPEHATVTGAGSNKKRRLKQGQSAPMDDHKAMIKSMKETQEELESRLIAANQKLNLKVTENTEFLTEKAILEEKLRNAHTGYENMVKIRKKIQQKLEKKLTAANQKLECEKLMKERQQELRRRLTEANRMLDTEVTKQNQTFKSILNIERMNVATVKKDIVNMRVEMQAAEAGKEKMVEFLLELIERKERFLECPVCMEIAAPPILCCSEQHLICSSCQPGLRECLECGTRYGDHPRRQRHAEGIAEEIEGFKEQLRQFTS